MALYYLSQSLQNIDMHGLSPSLIRLPLLLPLANKYRRNHLTINHITAIPHKENKVPISSTPYVILSKNVSFGEDLECVP